MSSVAFDGRLSFSEMGFRIKGKIFNGTAKGKAAELEKSPGDEGRFRGALLSPRVILT